MPEVKRVLMQEGNGAATTAGSKQEPRGLPSLPHFTPSSVDPDSIRFKDKAREKQRQKLLQQRAQQQVDTEAAKAGQKQGKDGASGPQAAAGQQQQHKSGERLPAAKRRKLQARDEMAELEADYRLLKKVRRGKLSEHEFDVAAGLSSDSELSSDAGLDEGDDDDDDDDVSGQGGHQSQAQAKALLGSAGSTKKGKKGKPSAAQGLPRPLAPKALASGSQAAGASQQNGHGSLLQQKLQSKMKKQKRKQWKKQHHQATAAV
jgi:ATP-dependent RNA helicase DDX55/SPB4